jgi:hypothetical protein
MQFCLPKGTVFLVWSAKERQAPPVPSGYRYCYRTVPTTYFCRLSTSRLASTPSRVLTINHRQPPHSLHLDQGTLFYTPTPSALVSRHQHQGLPPPSAPFSCIHFLLDQKTLSVALGRSRSQPYPHVPGSRPRLTSSSTHPPSLRSHNTRHHFFPTKEEEGG